MMKHLNWSHSHAVETTIVIAVQNNKGSTTFPEVVSIKINHHVFMFVLNVHVKGIVRDICKTAK